jgi:hypothetical protein
MPFASRGQQETVIAAAGDDFSDKLKNVMNTL